VDDDEDKLDDEEELERVEHGDDKLKMEFCLTGVNKASEDTSAEASNGSDNDSLKDKF
jgi:hypothetical protein